MRRLIALTTAVALALGLAGATVANGDSNRNSFKTNLTGYQEVPAISSSASGRLTLRVNDAASQISYTLTYSALQGGAAAAAHIHLGQPGANGGVLAFLCGGGSKPACLAAGGTVSGTIVAGDVLALPAQGVAAGDMAALLRAIRNGMTYANVHSATFPSGEIRGQIPGHANKGGND